MLLGTCASRLTEQYMAPVMKKLLCAARLQAPPMVKTWIRLCKTSTPKTEFCISHKFASKLYHIEHILSDRSFAIEKY